ncbi:MFS transporter small subunit [Paraburkholderia phosphatilytica]|nr:oxalate:formate antiporter [Paraburkholderia phosphatilytica]
MNAGQTDHALNAHPTNKALLAVFWLYVLIPLVWGVSNTLMQAMKLF